VRKRIGGVSRGAWLGDSIRIATVDDIETVVGLINRAFAPERVFLDRDRID